MGTFIIAELSANHGNDLDIIKASIKKVKEIGCDAMKIQTSRPDKITIDCDNEYFQIKNGTLWDGETLYSLYQKTYLPWEWHKEIFSYAKEVGITVFSAPFDEGAVDFLEECGNPIYKIASFEITDVNLIRRAAQCGKPMVISTGIATEEEISDAIMACREVGNNDITLLQCTSEYPARLEDANLATMVDMGERFNVKFGVSDHTIGNVVPCTAVALGACMVEKHFTLDKTIGGADADFSMDASDFEKMVKDIRNVERCIGNINYELSEKKINSRKFARSLFIIDDVKAGDMVSEENVRSIRPGDGLSPKFYTQVIGKHFKQDLRKGTPLSFELIED